MKKSASGGQKQLISNLFRIVRVNLPIKIEGLSQIEDETASLQIVATPSSSQIASKSVYKQEQRGKKFNQKQIVQSRPQTMQQQRGQGPFTRKMLAIASLQKIENEDEEAQSSRGSDTRRKRNAWEMRQPSTSIFTPAGRIQDIVQNKKSVPKKHTRGVYTTNQIPDLEKNDRRFSVQIKKRPIKSLSSVDSGTSREAHEIAPSPPPPLRLENVMKDRRGSVMQEYLLNIGKELNSSDIQQGAQADLLKKKMTKKEIKAFYEKQSLNYLAQGHNLKQQERVRVQNPVSSNEHWKQLGDRLQKTLLRQQTATVLGEEAPLSSKTITNRNQQASLKNSPRSQLQRSAEVNKPLVSNLFFNPENNLRSKVLAQELLQFDQQNKQLGSQSSLPQQSLEQQQQQYYSEQHNYTEGEQRHDFWTKHVPADLSFAPAKREPGKINAEARNTSHETKKHVLRKLDTEEGEQLQNLKLPQAWDQATYKMHKAQIKQQYSAIARSNTKILTTHSIRLTSLNSSETESVSAQNNVQESLSRVRGKLLTQQGIDKYKSTAAATRMQGIIKQLGEQSDIERLKFFMTEVVAEGRARIDEMFVSEPEIREYLLEYCLLNAEDFKYLMMNFFRFCVAQVADVVKQQNFPAACRVRKHVLQRVEDILISSLQRFKIAEHIIERMQSAWISSCERFLYPITVVDDIGGIQRVQKIMRQVHQLVCEDLLKATDYQRFGYSLEMAVCAILNDQPQEFEQYLNYACQDEQREQMQIQPYEYFLIKKNVWLALKDAVLEMHYKRRILEKLQYARYVLFEDFHFSRKSLRNELTISLFSKHPTFSSYFSHPEDKKTVNSLLDCFYGGLSEEDFLDMLRKQLHSDWTEKFFAILRETLLKVIPSLNTRIQNIALFQKDLEYKVYRLKAKAKVGPSVFQIIAENFDSAHKFVDEFIKFFRSWLNSLDNIVDPHTVKGAKTADLSFFDVVVRLALDVGSVFSVHDAHMAIPHYAINVSTFTYWTQGLKSFLNARGVS